MRKTFNVEDLKKIANHFLSSDNHSIEEKKGVCIILERILDKTDNDNGFRYLTCPDTSNDFFSREYY